MMSKIDFLNSREKWLKEVAAKCHEYATNEKYNNDRDFYVFQTNSDVCQPHILLIGINPGGNATYSSRRETLMAEKGCDRRTWEDLESDPKTLYEKPQWEIDYKEKGADVMRSRLKLLFYNDELNSILKKTMMMNSIYFNTKNEKELDQISPEIKNYCNQKTLEFIEIAKPKNVIFWSSEKKLKKLGITNFIQINPLIKTAKFNETNINVIPHYSYFGAYGYEKAKLMGDTLLEILK